VVAERLSRWSERLFRCRCSCADRPVVGERLSLGGRRECLDVGVRVRIVRWSERLFRCGCSCADCPVVGETV
jgi:hypothetical protein